MSDYYESDLADPDREIIRPKSKKRHDPFVNCKWAAGEWESSYYAWTPIHREQCAKHIKQLLNNPAWFKGKGSDDARAIIRNNKAKGGKPKPRRVA